MEQQINTLPQAPTKAAPNIGAIMFNNPNLNFSNRDSGILPIYANCIPTIELSKCAPFVDVKLLTPHPPVADDKKIGRGISQMRFLFGESGDPWGDDAEFKNLINVHAVNADVDASMTSTAIAENPTQTVAGMEVFTSPQTMIPFNSEHKDLSPPPATDDGAEFSRNTPIHDRMRPFMTLKDVQIKVHPAYGAQGTKTATMNIRVHDRSRLAEIAPLTRPDSLGLIEVLIEYGWAHPDGEETSGNPWGLLLNSLRAKEKYGVNGASLTFTASGEIDISIQLFTKGSYEMTNKLVINHLVADLHDEMSKLLKELNDQIRKVKGELGKNEEMYGSEILGKTNSLNEQVTMDNETRAELARVMATETFTSGEYAAIGDAMENVLSKMTEFTGDDGIINKATQEVMKSCHGPDPFAIPLDADKVAEAGVFGTAPGMSEDCWTAKGDTDWVSFGKLATTMIAAPLAATNRFEEIQLLFYPMNAYSMYARDHTVGSFPVHKDTLEKALNNLFKIQKSCTISTMISVFNRLIFSNKANPVYGFGDLYTTDTNGASKALTSVKAEDMTDAEKKIVNAAQGGGGSAYVTDSIIENYKKKIPGLRKKAMTQCYGDDGAPHKFKAPGVQLFIECVPMIPGDPNQDNGGPGDRGTICRLHFYDKQTTSYEGFQQLWESQRSQMFGTVNKKLCSDRTFVKSESGGCDWGPHANESLSALDGDFDIFEAIDSAGSTISDISKVPTDSQGKVMSDEYLRLKGGPQTLRYLISKNIPTIKYGSNYSACEQAQLSTQTDSAMASIHMQRGMSDSNTPPGTQDTGLPMQTYPGKLTLTMIGNPLLRYMQQFFCDFGTGTTLDDVYACIGLNHSLSPGSFKTTLEMTPTQKFGQYKTLVDNISNTIAIARKAEKESSD